MIQWIKKIFPKSLSKEAKSRIIEILKEDERSGRSVQEQLISEGLIEKSQRGAAFYAAIADLPIELYYIPKKILGQTLREPWLRLK